MLCRQWIQRHRRPRRPFQFRLRTIRLHIKIGMKLLNPLHNLRCRHAVAECGQLIHFHDFNVAAETSRTCWVRSE